MNHLFKRKIRRYIFAVIMLFVAGYMSIFIKDTIDARNPEVSLPIIEVISGYTAVPTAPRAGYEWEFGVKSVQSPFLSSIDVPIIAYDALPDTPILVRFSSPAEKITIYQGVGNTYEGKVFASEFEEMRYGINTPSTEGVFVYKVVAQFSRGKIVHYFALNVKSPHNIV